MTAVMTAVTEQHQQKQSENLICRKTNLFNYNSLQLNPSLPSNKYVSSTNTIESETEKKKRSRSILHGVSENSQQGGLLGLIYTLILYLIHILYMSCVACKSLQLYLSLKLQTLCAKEDDAIILQRILYDKKHLTKIPKHLTINISRELSTTRNLQDWETIKYQLSKATCWAFEFGIQEVSVYDSLGMMKSVEVDLYKQQSTLLHEWITEKSLNLKEEQQQKDFKFTILSAENGKRQMRYVTQEIIKKHFNDDINVDLVDKYMHTDTISDPDLMIVYDGLPHNYISLDDYPPWYIRLTEIVNCTSCHCLDYNVFSKCLYKFSKVEQRFGR
ncbi:Decaprenyl diphosphate synthase-like protein [Mycotypha africana]|uniref:Decaprenyl diphosphate synthase-like protein n=1 Tax=Mycotypha africana TaxID=64632 RepID=UPI002300B009|nr:Decaprenyl diphosphate synthase-like protein [Mycotypha africana]KAI8984522.1 Decaprenyl diphosphate synthase-like protein [Mycotypha africana]